MRRAPPLKPLQSKTTPTASASACIHPKSSLKGGGNGSSSYIVRKAWGPLRKVSRSTHDVEERPLEHQDGQEGGASSPVDSKRLGCNPVMTLTRSEGRMVMESPFSSPSGETKMDPVKEELRAEMGTHMGILLQQLKNEQAASNIQLSSMPPMRSSSRRRGPEGTHVLEVRAKEMRVQNGSTRRTRRTSRRRRRRLHL